MKGFHVEIYSNDFVDPLSPIKQCTNATVIDSELPKINDVSDDYPPLKLVRRELGGRIYIHAEPITEECYGRFAFGGRFIYTCDSRFSEITDYPIPLHDRDMRLERNSVNTRVQPQKEPIKYLFIILKERNGEQEYTHRCLHITTADNINFAAERFAGSFWGYGKKYPLSDGTWSFNGDCQLLRVYSIKEITKEQYDFLHSIFY